MSERGFYPELRDYLSWQLDQPVSKKRLNPLIAGIGFPLGIALTTGIAMQFGASLAVGLAIGVLGFVPIFALGVGAWAASRARPSSEQEKMRQSLRTYETNLLNWAKRKSRERDPVAMAILEYAALQNRRIQTALTRPVWKSNELESTWMDWKKKATEASERVMSETIWVSRDLLKPGDYENAPAVDYDDGLPTDLGQKYRYVLQMAAKMGQLADAVEHQAGDLSLQKQISLGDANAAIDSTLSDLDNLRSAYAELDELHVQA